MSNAPLPTALDALLNKVVQANGTQMPTRPAINLLGSGVSVVDNPTNNSTDLVISGGGSGSSTQSNVTITSGANNNVPTTAGTVLRLGFGANTPGAVTITGFSPPASIPAGQTARIRVFGPPGQSVTFTHADTRSSAGSRLSTIRGTPFVLYPRGASGSSANFEYDSTAQQWILGESGYDDAHEFRGRDFLAYEGTGDNAPLIMNSIAAAAASNWIKRIRLSAMTGTTQASFPTNQPIVFNNGGPSIALHGDGSNSVSIRAQGFLGPTIYAAPASMVPPTIAPIGATAWSGFTWAGSFGSGDQFLPLTWVDTMNLNQPHWTIEIAGVPNSFASAGYLFASSGRKRIGGSPTTAFAIQQGTNGHLGVTFTTTGSGQQSFTSNNPLTAGVFQFIECSYDGAFMRLFINGVLDSKQPATGSLQQGDEDMYVGTSTSSWPFGGALFNPPHWTLAQIRFSFDGPGGSGGARHATDSSYTPPSAPYSTTDTNTQLLLNFASSNISGPFIKGGTQWAPLGINANTPVYCPWLSLSTDQMQAPDLRGFTIINVIGGVGIWLHQSPSGALSDVEILGANNLIFLHDNCYEFRTYDVWGGTVPGTLGSSSGPVAPMTTGLFVNGADGILTFGPSQIFGNFPRGYHLILVDGGGSFRDGYWVSKALPNGQPGIIFAKSNGAASGWSFYDCNPGDEGGLLLEHTALFSSASVAGAPQFTTLQVYSEGASWQQTQSATACGIEIDGGGQYDFGHSPWMNGADTAPCFKLFGGNYPTSPVLVRTGSQTISTAEAPWMPELGSSGQLYLHFAARDGVFDVIQFAGNADQNASMVSFPKAKNHKVTTSVAWTADHKLTLAVGAAMKGERHKFWNNATSGHNLIVGGSTGTTVTIAYSATAAWTEVVCDGTNWIPG